MTDAAAPRRAGTGWLVLVAGLLAAAAWLTMGQDRSERPGPPSQDAEPAVADVDPDPDPETGPEIGAGSEPDAVTDSEAETETGSPSPPAETGMAKLRADFEAGVRDADAIEDEKLVRAIYEHHQGELGILREVRCQGSVCRIRARWSQQTTEPYNQALVEVVRELSREVNLEPDGPPDGLIVPMAIYVRRAESGPED